MVLGFLLLGSLVFLVLDSLVSRFFGSMILAFLITFVLVYWDPCISWFVLNGLGCLCLPYLLGLGLLGLELLVLGFCRLHGLGFLDSGLIDFLSLRFFWSHWPLVLDHGLLSLGLIGLFGFLTCLLLVFFVGSIASLLAPWPSWSWVPWSWADWPPWSGTP